MERGLDFHIKLHCFFFFFFLVKESCKILLICTDVLLFACLKLITILRKPLTIKEIAIYSSQYP